MPPSSALPPSAAPTRSFSSAPRKAKYRCNTPLRAHEFDLRPELLARRDASKVPFTQSQGAQILRSAQSLKTLISQTRTQDARSQEQSRIIFGDIRSLGERIVSRGFEARTVSSHLTALNWLADLLAAKGSDYLYIKCDGSPSARAFAFEILDEYMFMTFAVSKKKMLEVKAASTVKRYSKTLIALHQERDIDLSFLTARVNRIARGLTKMRVDLWGVRKKGQEVSHQPCHASPPGGASAGAQRRARACNSPS